MSPMEPQGQECQLNSLANQGGLQLYTYLISMAMQYIAMYLVAF